MTKNRSAFPIPQEAYDDGLTKRELFAAMALQGILANGTTDTSGAYIKRTALEAVACAQALIAELSRSVEGEGGC